MEVTKNMKRGDCVGFVIGLAVGLVGALVVYLKFNSKVNELQFEVDTMDNKVDERVNKIADELDEEQQMRIAKIVRDYTTKEKALEKFFQDQLVQQVEDSRDEIEATIYAEVENGAWRQFAERQEQKRIRNRAKDLGKSRLYKAILENEELTKDEVEELLEEVEDGPGIFIMHNKTRDKYFVNKSNRVLRSSLKSFEPSDTDLYSDVRDGNIFMVRVIYLQGSHFKSLSRLESDALELFGNDENGYN